jgi:hypothetical protein
MGEHMFFKKYFQVFTLDNFIVFLEFFLQFYISCCKWKFQPDTQSLQTLTISLLNLNSKPIIGRYFQVSELIMWKGNAVKQRDEKNLKLNFICIFGKPESFKNVKLICV